MLMIVEAGSEMALFYYYPTFDICYVSVILKVGSEPVISFFNKGEFFLRNLPYSFFVVYVINGISFQLVLLARYHIVSVQI